MRRYCVNRENPNKGKYEVHIYDCAHGPVGKTKEDLGMCRNWHAALAEAERRNYKPADLCGWCL